MLGRAGRQTPRHPPRARGDPCARTNGNSEARGLHRLFHVEHVIRPRKRPFRGCSGVVVRVCGSRGHAAPRGAPKGPTANLGGRISSLRRAHLRTVRQQGHPRVTPGRRPGCRALPGTTRGPPRLRFAAPDFAGIETRFAQGSPARAHHSRLAHCPRGAAATGRTAATSRHMLRPIESRKSADGAPPRHLAGPSLAPRCQPHPKGSPQSTALPPPGLCSTWNVAPEAKLPTPPQGAIKAPPNAAGWQAAFHVEQPQQPLRALYRPPRCASLVPRGPEPPPSRPCSAVRSQCGPTERPYWAALLSSPAAQPR